MIEPSVGVLCVKKEKFMPTGIYNHKRIHGMTKTKTYKSWIAMKQRCHNKKNLGYRNYGGRGITICEKWMSFENFYKDMGDRPENKTIDRIDNNGNYCPENCRWSTSREQANNKRSNVLITYKGKTKNITQWADEFNIKIGTIIKRLESGFSMEDIETTPVINNKGSRTNKIIKYCVDNPDKTVEDLFRVFNISVANAFYCVKEASKILNNRETICPNRKGDITN